MTFLEIVSELEPKDGDHERFASELAEDLQGDYVEVLWDPDQEVGYLAKRRDHA